MNTPVKRLVVLGLWVMGAALFTSPALAHHLWVIPEADGYAVARGTMPDTTEAYNPMAVTAIRALGSDGTEYSLSREDGKDRAFFKAPFPAVAAVRCDWGPRVTTTRGKKLMSRSDAEKQGFKVIKAFVSTQTSKTVFQDGEVLTRPLGLIFELVPETGPLGLTPGQNVNIKLLFEGKPLKQVDITGPDSVKTRTDDQGIAAVTLSKTDWQVISARHLVDLPNETELDYHQYMTFFIFRMKP
ncbi:DUF4198 domain-containing protein [Desulfatiferula olefinivorans]